MPERISFTKKAIEALEPFELPGERRWVYDTKTPALALMITSAGVKTFYLYKRVKGKPERVKLGRFPELTVEAAREQALAKLGEIAKGLDPMEERRLGRRDSTFGEIFQRYMDGHAKLKKRTWEDDQAMYDLHLKDWENRKASGIDVEAVQALHNKLGKAHPYAANRLLALLSKVYNYAKRPNPAAGVERFREKSRDRFLSGDELPQFFKALEDDPNEVLRDFFKMALFTGARRANVQEMRWSEVSMEAGTWRIPQTKSGDGLTVHLSAQALEILKRRQADNPGLSKGKFKDAPFVFPAHGKTGHVVEPKSAWARILKAAGLSDLRVHDLRRTLGSWQAATGASLPVIGKSLGHKNQTTTAIYARLNLDPVKASVDTATEAMMAAAVGKAKD